MDETQRRSGGNVPQRLEVAALTAALAVAVGALTILGRLAVPYRTPAVWDGMPQFMTARAWRDVEALATRFPRRWSGSQDRARAADWLAATLAEIGLEVHRDRFEVALGQSTPVVLENVWGVSRGAGRPDEIIVAVGNYDMAPTSVQAASDTAGHVGTILELARVVHATPHHRTLTVLFPDGEEWGMLGTRHFVRTFPDRMRIVAALSIEDLDAGTLRALGIDGIGQSRGFAPMWLRALAAAAAHREQYPVEEVPPVIEWLQRSVLVSATDQGPFLAQGIASIDLAGRGGDRAQQDEIYHLPGDTIEKMRAASLGAYGRIQERIVRTIDAMPEVPVESPSYLRLASDRVVPHGRLAVVQMTLLLPLIVAAVRAFRGRRRDLAPLRGIAAGMRGEWRDALVFLAVALVGLAALLVLPRVGLMADYELYPPPPRHPALTQVNWTAVAIVTSVVACFGYPLRRTLGRTARTLADAEERLGALFVGLLAIAIVSFLDNPFGAVTFLLAPTLGWVWVTPGTRRDHRLLNVLLIAIGFLPIVSLILQYGQALRIGSFILWYLMMGIAYGQFTLLRVILTLATLVVGIRLLIVSAFGRQPSLTAAAREARSAP
jgi:peptidase M28-like protein